ncbi:hypothetical protein [Actinoplanes sp. NPDC023714]|uniref:hypothetical protein n=1 Tax=Actinoplanes sp. NPDC023714 TaxID=3154322 RepID=UPI0033D0298A
MSRVLERERGIVIASPPLEATAFQVENVRWAYVFYENGLSVNRGSYFVIKQEH